ncbi:hypothetical protein [Thermus tengchongensis]|uniref:Uncharacterized protein n=1 Tax=Thermus tengchongensis TaxID=1214928 RepID=A0ABY2K8G4_9DEIN|nr:hypothetical protein [Thermus tengchongensis]TFU17523.1 hypothetical protein E0489_01730 [Thermus tengchongensis]
MVKRLFGTLVLSSLLALAHQPFWNPGSPSPEAAYPVARPEVPRPSWAAWGPGNGPSSALRFRRASP